MITIAASKADETTATTGTPDIGADGKPTGTSTGISGNSFGGFFAISVVLQDAWAKVLGDANLKAGNNITVKSSADERTTTKGLSADAMTAGAKTAASQTVNQAVAIFMGIIDKVKGAITEPSAEEN